MRSHVVQHDFGDEGWCQYALVFYQHGGDGANDKPCVVVVGFGMDKYKHRLLCWVELDAVMDVPALFKARVPEVVRRDHAGIRSTLWVEQPAPDALHKEFYRLSPTYMFDFRACRPAWVLDWESGDLAMDKFRRQRPR